MITATMICLSILLLNCPPDLEPFSTRRATVDGFTSTTGSMENSQRHIMVSYVDNRTSVGNRFFSLGYATIGNPQNDQPTDIIYKMDGILPEGAYHIINNRPPTDSNYENISICAEDGKVALVIEDAEFSSGDYRSYHWDFEIYIDLLGDINMDGIVDNYDLVEVLTTWGTDYANADLNNDGIVNEDDLAILLGVWGEID